MLLLVSMWPWVAGSGCCASGRFPLADMQSKSLRTPYDTLDYFRTAVRYDDWEAIYGLLSPETQAYVTKKVGRFAFKTFAADLKYRDLDGKARGAVADLTIAELLHRSEIIDTEWDKRSRTWRVQLLYSDGKGAPLIPPGKTNFPLINARLPGSTEDRWTVGLYEWIRENSP